MEQREVKVSINNELFENFHMTAFYVLSSKHSLHRTVNGVIVQGRNERNKKVSIFQ